MFCFCYFFFHGEIINKHFSFHYTPVFMTDNFHMHIHKVHSFRYFVRMKVCTPSFKRSLWKTHAQQQQEMLHLSLSSTYLYIYIARYVWEYETVSKHGQLCQQRRKKTPNATQHSDKGCYEWKRWLFFLEEWTDGRELSADSLRLYCAYSRKKKALRKAVMYFLCSEMIAERRTTSKHTWNMALVIYAATCERCVCVCDGCWQARRNSDIWNKIDR